MQKKIFLFIVLVLVLFLGFLAQNRESLRLGEKNTPTKEFAEFFSRRMAVLGIERVGQPIEGFDAFILKRAFPNLQDIDFHNVKTNEGHYAFTQGELIYMRDQDMPVTSAEQTVSFEGYDILLRNLSDRLGIAIKSIESINVIINSIVIHEREVVLCTLEQRKAEGCIALYNPVCGKVNVQCVTTPCPPVYETLSNTCEACKNSLVESYTMGECLSQDL